MSDNIGDGRNGGSGPGVVTRGAGEADPTPVVHRTGAESDGDGSVSSVVLEAVAEAKGTVPADLSVPLYEAVDPEALDRLFETSGDTAGGRVQFAYADYRVAVTVDDDVYVYVYADRSEP
jgi:hypothetical protein